MVIGREVVPSEEGQFVLRIDALKANVHGAYDVPAEHKLADEIRRTATCPSFYSMIRMVAGWRLPQAMQAFQHGIWISWQVWGSQAASQYGALRQVWTYQSTVLGTRSTNL